MQLRKGAAVQLIDIIVRLKADITATQREYQWTRHRRNQIAPCDMYHSDLLMKRKFGIPTCVSILNLGYTVNSCKIQTPWRIISKWQPDRYVSMWKIKANSQLSESMLL